MTEESVVWGSKGGTPYTTGMFDNLICNGFPAILCPQCDRDPFT